MMLPRLLNSLDRQPQWRVAVVAAVATCLIVFADAAVGETTTLWVLLAPPILIASWRLGTRAAGLLTLSVFLPTLFRADVIDTTGSSEPGLWELVSRWLALILLAFVTSRWHQSVLRAQEAAANDPLTGLANRNSFFQRAEAERNRSRRSNTPLTLAYLDCDAFKQINDTLGHLVGDQLLKTIAETIRSRVRGYDLVARLGGDEFALLLPETEPQAAQQIVERVRASLQEETTSRGWKVTFSIGVATYREVSESVQEMVGEADGLMYEVKRASKNGVRYKTFGE